MKRFMAVLLLLILPPVVYFLAWGANRNDELWRAEGELSELDKRIEMARAAQRKLTQFHEELARLDEELAKLHVILPAQMAIDAIHETSKATAEGNGVLLTRFEAAALTSAPPMQRQSVRAEVIGSVEGTAGFLRDLQNAARVIDVSSVTLRTDPAGWRTDFIMTCYALPDPR